MVGNAGEESGQRSSFKRVTDGLLLLDPRAFIQFPVLLRLITRAKLPAVHDADLGRYAITFMGAAHCLQQ